MLPNSQDVLLAAEQPASENRYNNASESYEKLASLVTDNFAILHYLTLAASYSDEQELISSRNAPFKYSLHLPQRGKPVSYRWPRPKVPSAVVHRPSGYVVSADNLSICADAIRQLSTRPAPPLLVAELSDIEQYTAQIHYCLRRLREIQGAP